MIKRKIDHKYKTTYPKVDKLIKILVAEKLDLEGAVRNGAKLNEIEKTLITDKRLYLPSTYLHALLTNGGTRKKHLSSKNKHHTKTALRKTQKKYSSSK